MFSGSACDRLLEHRQGPLQMLALIAPKIAEVIEGSNILREFVQYLLQPFLGVRQPVLFHVDRRQDEPDIAERLAVLVGRVVRVEPFERSRGRPVPPRPAAWPGTAPRLRGRPCARSSVRAWLPRAPPPAPCRSPWPASRRRSGRNSVRRARSGSSLSSSTRWNASAARAASSCSNSRQPVVHGELTGCRAGLLQRLVPELLRSLEVAGLRLEQRHGHQHARCRRMAQVGDLGQRHSLPVVPAASGSLTSGSILASSGDSDPVCPTTSPSCSSSGASCCCRMKISTRP